MQALGQQLSWLGLSKSSYLKTANAEAFSLLEREVQWALALSFKKSREKLSVYWQSKKACWGRFAWGLGSPGFSLYFTSDLLEQILGTAAPEFLEVPLLPSWGSTNTLRVEGTRAGVLVSWHTGSGPFALHHRGEEKTADVEKSSEKPSRESTSVEVHKLYPSQVTLSYYLPPSSSWEREETS